MQELHGVELGAFRSESFFGSPVNGRVFQQSVAWRRRFVVRLLHLGSNPRLLTKLEGRLEVVHVQSDRVIQVRERLARHQPCESPMPNESPDDGTILLFNPGLIVFLMCS
jgi:hypothetical protein